MLAAHLEAGVANFESRVRIPMLLGWLVLTHADAMQHYDFENKTVLVTGASTGIGREFAVQLSRRGARVLLVARNEARLSALARELTARGSTADHVAMDLSLPGASRRLFDEVMRRGYSVDVLINNAGFGDHHRFVDQPLDAVQGQVMLNVLALTELSHAFLPSIKTKRGGLILVASTAAFQPVPYLAVYAATKAYVLSFGEALWGELSSHAVRVLTLCPGSTDTPFFERAGEAAALGDKATPESVVSAALRAFDARRPYVIPGFMNWFRSFMSRLASRRFVIGVSERLMRPSATA